MIPHGRGHHDALADAVVASGGRVVDPMDANAIIWTDPYDATGLGDLLVANPAIAWIALPFAGIEPFQGLLDHKRAWTCGKGVYAPPVAEHALGLLLAGFRGIGAYAQRTTWSAPQGDNLYGAKVVIFGGGEICRQLLELLRPFGVEATVVRNRDEPVAGAVATVGLDARNAVLADADAVVLALALTPRTRRVIDSAALACMPRHAWLVNVARGAHVDTDALVGALQNGEIAGAALDVTDPEPLGDDHPLWGFENVIITPHVGNTPEMARSLLAQRVAENVARFRAGAELLGPVDVDLGY
ncbi:MAG: D-isomer specific 2-hydroxyacid dehydrogenase family protein [Nitriliruptoraceae bacterium]